jgi:hypothetical protein
MPLTRTPVRASSRTLALASSRTSVLACTLLVAYGGLLPRSSRAQFPDSQPVTPDIKAFAAQYVAAINAKDSAKLWSYLTPESRACVTTENKDVYATLFAVQMEETIPRDYLLNLTPVNQNNAKAMADRQYFPVKPEHQLQIDYQLGNDSYGIVLFLVRENGHWLAAQPCATDKFIAEFRTDAPEREKFKQTAAQIKDPLRGQLLALIAQHDTAAANSRYKEATGSDYHTAVLVIYALKETTIPSPPPMPAPVSK